MPNPPQAKTPRYIRNLLASGSNHDFTLTSLRQVNDFIADTIPITYYAVEIVQHATGEPLYTSNAVGTTPFEALRNVLIKHGVTFR